MDTTQHMTCGSTKDGPSLYAVVPEGLSSSCDLQGGHGGNLHSGIVAGQRVFWSRQSRGLVDVLGLTEEQDRERRARLGRDLDAIREAERAVYQ